MSYLRIGPLVRATNTTSAVIWAEFSHPCAVLLSAQPLDRTAVTQIDSIHVHTHTVTIGGRFYIAPQLQGLQPATWYTYWLSLVTQIESNEQTERLGKQFVFCFRTMNAVDEQNTLEPLRLVYGSCRKFVVPQIDALSAFGRWLQEHSEQRETVWPHLLLLLGDQIYADHPPEEVQQQYPQLSDGATTFEDFALLYEYAWTQDNDVRRVFACIPTYMMYDDHEIVNNWNITPQWYTTMLQTGRQQVLVDGLIAYWVYQGWGNLVQRQNTQYPLLQVMQGAERSGEDILEVLRFHIRREVCGEDTGHWHYEIQTTPSIFVLNTRSERTTIFTDQQDDIYGPTRIISQAQMQELTTWMQEHDTSPSLLASSVPILLPPAIGLAEYIMGIRLWEQRIRWLGRRVARIQQRFALRTSLEHWPIFSQTWNEFIQVFTKRHHDLFVLSGDVHFSYAAEARQIFAKTTKARLIQLVSSPLQNTLGKQSERLVKRQAHITRLIYGGLNTRILQLRIPDTKKRIQCDMLFQNTLAYLTLTPDETKMYKVQQEYFGVIDGQLQRVGYTVLPE